MNAAPFKNTCFDLSGRTALVTGGSRGLGKEMALILAQAGADLVICSRKESEIKAAAQQITQATGSKVIPLVADVGKRAEACRLADEANRALGKIDILISNAGWNIPQPVDAVRDEDWDALVELNLTSSMVLTRALAPSMMERQWGRVIYISSIMAFASTPDRIAYSTTKAALIGMVKANALRLGPSGITVNAIAPGPFATEMPMSILTEQQKETFASRTAVGRWGKPAELAPTALLLASNAGSYTTGSVVVVDGGVTARMW